MRLLLEFRNDYPEIRTFSFYEDVFDSIENDGEEASAGICLQRYARKDVNDIEGDPYCENESEDVEYRYKLKYSRFGIYESLFFEFKHRDNQPWKRGTSDLTFYDIEYNEHYTPRCEDKVIFERKFSNLCTGSFYSLPYVGDDIRFIVYNDSKALKEYLLWASVRFYNRCPSFQNIGGTWPIESHPEEGVCTQDWRVIETTFISIADE